jgi:hypothetical protein
VLITAVIVVCGGHPELKKTGLWPGAPPKKSNPCCLWGLIGIQSLLQFILRRQAGKD